MATKSCKFSAVAHNTGTINRYVNDNASLIFKLHNDILLEIFRVNANMDEDPPLEEYQIITQGTPRAINTTRSSSQVNYLWRDLILNSPTVWADLIDLHVLESAGGYWQEEVIRRTRNSSLHIKGSIFLKSLGKSEPWWLGFLNHHWGRIRKFDIVVKTGNFHIDWFDEYLVVNYRQAAKYRQALPFLARSTSTLESFRIVFPYPYDPLEVGATLFDNHAPKLQGFQSKRMVFNTENPLILQLRSLHVHEYAGQIFKSVDSLYQILSKAPLLESLSIHRRRRRVDPSRRRAPGTHSPSTIAIFGNPSIEG